MVFVAVIGSFLMAQTDIQSPNIQPLVPPNQNGLAITIETKSAPAVLSNKPLIINEITKVEDLENLIQILSANANINLKVQFKPQFQFDADIESANLFWKLLRPLRINFPKRENYLDQFLPNVELGQAGKDFFAEFKTLQNESHLYFSFYDGINPSTLPIRLVTSRLGTFQLSLSQLALFAFKDDSGSYQKALPFVGDLSLNDGDQQRSCYGVIFESPDTGKWMYRFMVFNHGPRTDPLLNLKQMTDTELWMDNFYNMACMATTSCTFEELKKVSNPNEISKAQPILLGLEDQAMFLIEGTFDGSTRERILAHLYLKPKEKGFRIPGILPGFMASLHSDTLIHFVYQDFFRDESIPMVTLDFIQPDKKSVIKPAQVRMDWRPFKSFTEKSQDKSNEAGKGRGTFSWIFGELTQRTIDIPLWISSDFILRARGDRVLITRSKADIYSNNKLKKRFEFE